MSGHWDVTGSRSVRCLLDLDPDLADELDPSLQRLARAAATAETIAFEAGSADLSPCLRAAASGPGVLALDGVLALSVRVGDRTCAELMGGGDLMQPQGVDADGLLSCETSWRALVPVRVAVLDAAFARRVRFWPQISQALLRRSARRIVNLNVQRAIAAQPRLEVRLALLLWHLAGRWGKVEHGGVRLTIPLTHQLLGHLVGAERPSISHALARLANAGMVTGTGGEWHLHGSLEEVPVAAPTVIGRAERIVAAVGAAHGG